MFTIESRSSKATCEQMGTEIHVILLHRFHSTIDQMFIYWLRNAMQVHDLLVSQE